MVEKGGVCLLGLYQRIRESENQSIRESENQRIRESEYQKELIDRGHSMNFFFSIFNMLSKLNILKRGRVVK